MNRNDLNAFCANLLYWSDGQRMTLEDADALITNWTAEGYADELPTGATAADIMTEYNYLLEV